MASCARYVCLCVVSITTLFAATLRGEEPAAAQDQPDQAALEKMMAEYGRVTEHHEGFKHLVGTWNTEMTCYMPGSPSGPQEGTATFRLLLGGRFLQQRFQGDFGGEKFRGIGITGYDNAQKKYVGIWIDNASTGIMHTTGSYDEKTHVMTETGEAVMPTGPMKMKMVTRPVDDKKFVFTMSLLTPDDGEQKMMEITYTRPADEAGKAAAKKQREAKPAEK